MKRMWRTQVGGIMVACVLLIPALLFGQLSNGGYENWTGGMPDDWFGDTALTITQESGTVHGGSYSAEVYWDDDDQGLCDFTHDTISVNEGQSYQFSVWAFDNDDAGRCRLAVWWVDGSSAWGTEYTTDSTDWQEITFDVTVPAGITQAIPVIRFYDVYANWDGDAVIYVDDADWQTSSVPVDTVTIYDIQYTTDPSGDSPYDGSIVQTEGIVTGVCDLTSVKGFFLQELDRGPWNGVFAYTGASPTVNEGDSIRLVAEVDEYYDCTELKNIVSLDVLATGVTLPAPIVVEDEDAKQEMYEGVLLKVEREICTADTADLGYGEWKVGVLRVDDMGYVYNPTKTRRYDVTGPLNYTYDSFKLEPRSAADITTYPLSTTDIFWTPFAPESNDPVAVSAMIHVFEGASVQNDVLYYSDDGWSTQNSASRDSLVSGTFYYTVPGLPASRGDVDFYIYAESNTGQTEYSDTNRYHIWSTLPQVKLNEVYYDADTALSQEPYSEWFELYNPTGSDIDLGGYVVSDDPSPCNTGAQMDTCFTIPGGTILPAHGHIVLAYDADSFALDWPSCPATVVAYGTASPNLRLGNSGDDLHLTYNGYTVDNMWFGIGGDMADLGHAAVDADPGKSLIRNPDGEDTDVPEDDWVVSDSSVTGLPTPGEANGGYMCGDCNGDDLLTTGDGFYLLNYFGAGPAPVDMRGADINGDCTWTTGDGFELLNYFGSSGTLNCDLCWPGCTNCD
jgi:hypothetical protein